MGDVDVSHPYFADDQPLGTKMWPSFGDGGHGQLAILVRSKSMGFLSLDALFLVWGRGFTASIVDDNR